MSKKNIAVICGIAAAALIAAILVSSFIISPASATETQNDTVTTDKNITFKSYDSIYDYIESMNAEGSTSPGTGMAVAEEVLEEAAVADTAAAEIPAEAKSSSAKESVTTESSSYSSTNVQVEGIDEADIIKTDGEYIYYLCDYTLYIAKADGKNTKVTSEISLEPEYGSDAADSAQYYTDMFLYGDRLYIIGNGWKSTEINDSDSYIYFDTEMTYTDVYNVSDRTSPEKETQFAQSGSYVSSRLSDGRIYIISSQYIWNAYRDYPESFIPSAREGNGKAEAVNPGSISVIPGSTQQSYTFITVTDAAEPAYINKKAVLGGTSTVYMNSGYLMIADSEYSQDETDIHKDSKGRNVVVRTSGSSTRLALYDTDTLDFLSSGKVDGYLHNQFAMDIYKDVIRLVTTTSTNTETIYTDGIDTYDYDSSTSNNMYTLDTEMNVLDKLTGLAEDEVIQSVRFDREAAYFVTFRNTDPLFCVDASDPENLKIKDVVKISGFSAYLQNYGEGQLLGIGYEADSKNGMTECVKLTMFDTAVSTDINVLDTYHIEEATYTSVADNHKAALIDAGKNIIGFPADTGYYLFSYTDDGFKENACLDTTGWYDSYNMRGLYINDMIYLVDSQQIHVVSMDDYSLVKVVDF